MDDSALDRDAVVDMLNDLIRVTEDSHLGYQRAAEDAADAALKELLNDIAAQRGAIVRDLQARVAALGGAPEATGTFLGGAHRMVEEIKAVFGARHQDAIVADIVRTEMETLGRFEREAERNDLPVEVRAALMEHAVRIQADRERVARHAPEAA